MKALRRAVRFASLLLGVYLATAVATVVLVESNSSHLRAQLDELRHSSQLTTGTITSFEPHNSVCYTQSWMKTAPAQSNPGGR